MQTRNEYYFPLETNILNEENVSTLIEECGPKGFGTYIMILGELRRSAGYTCGINTLKGVARRCKIDARVLGKVIYNYNLFEVKQEEETIRVTSPYLKRVMAAYEEKIRKSAEAGKKNADKSKRNRKGQFTIADGTIEQNRIEQNKIKKNRTATAVAGAEAGSNADDYIRQATEDDGWMETIATTSGFHDMFIRNPDAVTEAFRSHVRLQGTESEIRSVKDAKSYLANFIRPGTRTGKRVAELLAKQEELRRHDSPHRFETIDPQTGERTYFGNPIPPEAPPRPNDNVVWSHELRQWI